MAGFHKDKKTGKFYCDICNKEIDNQIIFSNYNYFGDNLEHKCEEKQKVYIPVNLTYL